MRRLEPGFGLGLLALAMVMLVNLFSAEHQLCQGAAGFPQLGMRS